MKLHELFCQLFYEKGKETLVYYWHGFIFNAIDGSTLVLPNTPDIKATFGTHKNGRKDSKTLYETVMGGLMVLFDVLNHLITYAEVLLFLIQNLAQYTEPIRPKRKKSLAKKRNLHTQTNFRRAA